MARRHGARLGGGRGVRLCPVPPPLLPLHVPCLAQSWVTQWALSSTSDAITCSPHVCEVCLVKPCFCTLLCKIKKKLEASESAEKDKIPMRSFSAFCVFHWSLHFKANLTPDSFALLPHVCSGAAELDKKKNTQRDLDT